MPTCSLEREVKGNAAFYWISGKFDGSCAWELSGRLEGEPFSEVVVDFSQASDFVVAMPGQLDAPIDQGGTNVSGGQRQRLAIARALVRRPAIYLFDDCFSALDAATDSRLRSALRSETADATVVIVAQRVSTILHADRIVVLDAGRIVGIGNHRELLSSTDAYREIVESQLGEEAVA